MNYEIRAEVLSPLHIGNGAQWDKLDYVIKQGRAWFINYSKFISRLSPPDRKMFNDLLDTANYQGLSDFISKHINEQEQQDFLYSAGLLESFKEYMRNKGASTQNRFIIEQFIKSGNTPYIPGSSIKGALRTVFLKHLFDELPDNDKNSLKSIMVQHNRNIKNLKRQRLFREMNKELQNISRELEYRLIASDFIFDRNKKWKELRIVPTRDIFKFLHISDAALPPNSISIGTVQNYSVHSHRSKGIEMLFELIPSKTEFTFNISFDNRAFERSSAAKEVIVPKRLSGPVLPEVRELFKMAKHSFEAELNIYENIARGWQELKDALVILKRPYENIKNDENSTIIHLGRETQYFVKTIPEIARDFMEKKDNSVNLIKSRSGALWPLGFVKLTITG